MTKKTIIVILAVVIGLVLIKSFFKAPSANVTNHPSSSPSLHVIPAKDEEMPGVETRATNDPSDQTQEVTNAKYNEPVKDAVLTY